jgi:hypothetical protein
MSPAEAIYLLCTATSIAAALLLLRQYRASRTGLLFWSSIGFFGLALNSVLVYIDLALVPTIDLSLPRSIAGAVAMLAIVYGLVREAVA